MKMYQSIRSNLAVLGIYDSQSNKVNRNNVKSFLILFLLYLTAAFICAFLFIEAQSLDEMSESFTTALTTVICAADLTIFILKTEKLFEFMNNFESIIAKSEFNLIY